MLLPTHAPDPKEDWPIDKIVGKRYNKRKKQEEYLVKYLYYDNTFNEWRRKNEVVEGEADRRE